MSSENSHTFTIGDFGITTNLMETSIFMRIINGITFQCFESMIDIHDLDLSFKNKQVYDMITNCFDDTMENYNVHITMKSASLQLDYSIIFDKLFDVNFTVILPEKLMSNDSKLTMNFHKIEAGYKSEIKRLEDKITKMEEMIDCLMNMEQCMNECTRNNVYTTLNLCLNVKELTYTDLYHPSDGSYFKYIHKIKYFYQLEKLILNTTSININFSNKTLKVLDIYKTHTIPMSSLKGLENLPSLEVIDIRVDTLNNADNIIPYLHKNIKKITFYNGYGKETSSKLTPYCKANGIELLYT